MVVMLLLKVNWLREKERFHVGNDEATNACVRCMEIDIGLLRRNVSGKNDEGVNAYVSCLGKRICIERIEDFMSEHYWHNVHVDGMEINTSIARRKYLI